MDRDTKRSEKTARRKKQLRIRVFFGALFLILGIAAAVWLIIRYTPTNQRMSLEEYAQYLSSEADATEVEMGTVNGFPCVSYKLPEQDSISVTFTTQAGYALEVTCAPASVENAELVWGAVIASIQAAE